MYLSSSPKKRCKPASLTGLVRRLPQPEHPLVGQTKPTPALPENIICFQRRAANELNKPRLGRAMHHRHVLIVPITGTVTVCVDDKTLDLGPGQALVVLPFQFHHYLPPKRHGLQWLFVTFEYPPGVNLESLRNHCFNLDQGLIKLLADFLRAYHRSHVVGTAALLLALFLVQLCPPSLNTDALRPADPASSLLPRINHAFQRHRPALPSIGELAAELGISQSHLRTRFRDTCGVSIGKHLRHLRLERARGMLHMSAARVSEIAEHCGFGSLFSFSRAFRKAYGVSPSRYDGTQSGLAQSH